MKSFKLFILFLAFSTNVFCQKDTTIVKVKSSWYGRSMPVSLYTGAGYIQDKVAQNIEFGRSFGVIDAGIAMGRINQRLDSTNFIEGRITMDASQYGPVSSEISVGAGHIFKSSTPIMLEISYSIFYQFTKKWGLGVVTGYYDFSGNTNDVSKTFYGIFLRYGLLRDMNGILQNRKTKMHHRGR